MKPIVYPYMSLQILIYPYISLFIPIYMCVPSVAYFVPSTVVLYTPEAQGLGGLYELTIGLMAPHVRVN